MGKEKGQEPQNKSSRWHGTLLVTGWDAGGGANNNGAAEEELPGMAADTLKAGWQLGLIPWHLFRLLRTHLGGHGICSLG